MDEDLLTVAAEGEDAHHQQAAPLDLEIGQRIAFRCLDLRGARLGANFSRKI